MSPYPYAIQWVIRPTPWRSASITETELGGIVVEFDA